MIISINSPVTSTDANSVARSGGAVKLACCTNFGQRRGMRLAL